MQAPAEISLFPKPHCVLLKVSALFIFLYVNHFIPASFVLDKHGISFSVRRSTPAFVYHYYDNSILQNMKIGITHSQRRFLVMWFPLIKLDETNAKDMTYIRLPQIEKLQSSGKDIKVTFYIRSSILRISDFTSFYSAYHIKYLQYDNVEKSAADDDNFVKYKEIIKYLTKTRQTIDISNYIRTLLKHDGIIMSLLILICPDKSYNNGTDRLIVFDDSINAELFSTRRLKGINYFEIMFYHVCV